MKIKVGKRIRKIGFSDASVSKKERADNIKKAISDFEKSTGKKLPVVFIDLGKIYRNEEKIIKQLEEEYRANPSDENKRKLIKRTKNFNVYKGYKLPINFSQEEIEEFDKIEDSLSDFKLTDETIKDITSFNFDTFKKEKQNYRLERREKIAEQENTNQKKFSLRKSTPIVSSKDDAYRIGNNPFKKIKNLIKQKEKNDKERG